MLYPIRTEFPHFVSRIKVIRRMLAEGPGGFQGGMSAKKYMPISKITKPTDNRKSLSTSSHTESI